MLELAFQTLALRALCEERERALMELGPKVFKKLKARLSDLHGASNVGALPKSNFKVTGEKVVSQLEGDIQLVFVQNHPTAPKNHGEIDWNLVSRIKIIGIGDL